MIPRPEVERVSPEEQARRMAAILDNLDQLDRARLRARCASGEAQRDRATMGAAAARAEAVRLEAQLQRIEAERGEAGPGAGDVEKRASAYLAAIEGGSRGAGNSLGAAAFRAALALVRGWALSEDAALTMLEREYAPRCSPPWTHRELLGMVRRASMATRTGYGWLLNAPR